MIFKCTVFFLSVCLVKCFPPPHPAVVAVRQAEELLPSHLRSPALRNPHLQDILSVTSLLHHGENLVFEREADNVPRNEIYKILTHAGFLRRQNYVNQYKPEYFGNYPSQDASFILNPEDLQYL